MSYVNRGQFRVQLSLRNQVFTTMDQASIVVDEANILIEIWRDGQYITAAEIRLDPGEEPEEDVEQIYPAVLIWDDYKGEAAPNVRVYGDWKAGDDDSIG